MKLSLIVCVIVSIFLLATLSVPNAGAYSTKIFTTTENFDAGSKLGGSVDYFLDDGVDQPTLMPVNTPSAYFNLDRTYIVYEGGAGYTPIVSYYNHTSDTWASPVIVSNINPIVGDGHGAPVIVIDSSGFIHITYGSHNSEMKYVKSTNARDISTWVRMNDIDVSGTYPHLFVDGSTLRIIYRTTTLIGGDWAIRNSTDGGNNWGSEQIILDFGASDTAYIGGSELRGSRITFSFVKFTNVDTFRHHIYSCYYNTIDGHVYSFPNIDLGITLDSTEADSNCRIVNTSSDETWYTAMKTSPLVGSDNTYIIYSRKVSGTWVQRFIYWNGTAWQPSIDIGITLDDSSGYSDMIVTNSSSIEAFITSKGGTSLYDGDMERWVWNGLSWTFQETLISESVSGLGVNEPNVPINFNPELKVFFQEFIPNVQAAHSKLYAWGSGGFLRSTFVPDRAIETETERFNVVSGTFELASIDGDKFSVNDTDAETFRWDRISGRPLIGTDEECGSVTRNISLGTFNLNVSNSGSPGSCRRGIRSSASITGNWDIRIKMDEIYRFDSSSGTTVFEFSIVNSAIPYCSLTGTPTSTDGLLYQVFRTNGAGPVIINAFTCVNSAFTQVGTNTDLPGNPLWLRITRSTNTFTWYYSTNGIDWTQDEQTTNSNIPNPVYSVFSNFAGGGTVVPILSNKLDDYNVASGLIEVGGYERSGTWTSEIQIWVSPDVVRSITIDYTGISSTNFIDSVAIVSTTNVSLFVYDINIISGSSVTITLPTDIAIYDLLKQNWAIRIVLNGDSLGTVIVSSVTVTLDKDLIITALVDGSWVMGFFALITLGLMGAWALKKKRGGR